ncbi:hypothetical protein AB3S75_018873 [Citrus x aurantiifolia]
MSQAKTPFQGMIKDFKVRAACYKQDWIGIRCTGLRILDFFASCSPCNRLRKAIKQGYRWNPRHGRNCSFYGSCF